MINNCVVWIMGLSGSGKTTTALSLIDVLRRKGHRVVHLDGDELRAVLNRYENYSKDKRIELALTYGKLAELIASQGLIVIVSSIGLYNELQVWLKQNIENYFEVLLDAPLELLYRRDNKGIYKTENGSSREFVMGVNIQPEFPKKPDVRIVVSEEMSALQNVETILNHFMARFQLGE